MKRSRSIALLLISGASVGSFSGCSQGSRPVKISSQCFYVNDFHVPGVGYYHAPFNRFFAYPYNYRSAVNGSYYAGGSWQAAPFQSIINISSPSQATALAAEAARTDVDRGGFGRSSYYGGWG